MTTIFYDGKSVVSDSASYDETDMYCGSLKKIHRLSDGRLAAGSGDYESILLAIDWLENGGDKPKVEPNFSLLIVHPDGTPKIMHSKLVEINAEIPISIGTGKEYAMGAYAAMKDDNTGSRLSKAIDAVSIACSLDAWSRGPICDVRIDS